MRKMVAYELLSLDGVAEQPDEFITDFDDLMRENLGRVIAAQDAVLLGRRTYDDWAGFWPTSGIEPFASFINGVQKFVVTSTPLEQEWTPTVVVEGSIGDFVTELKQQPGGDIGIHGSISLTQSLLEASLVDELRVVIAIRCSRDSDLAPASRCARRSERGRSRRPPCRSTSAAPP